MPAGKSRPAPWVDKQCSRRGAESMREGNDQQPVDGSKGRERQLWPASCCLRSSSHRHPSTVCSGRALCVASSQFSTRHKRNYSPASFFAFLRRRFRSFLRASAVGRLGASSGPSGRLYAGSVSAVASACGALRDVRLRRCRRFRRLPSATTSASSEPAGRWSSVLGGNGSGSRPSSRISKPISRSIRRSMLRSPGLHSVMEMPVAPARPVRPMR